MQLSTPSLLRLNILQIMFQAAVATVMGGVMGGATGARVALRRRRKREQPEKTSCGEVHGCVRVRVWRYSCNEAPPPRSSSHCTRGARAGWVVAHTFLRFEQGRFRAVRLTGSHGLGYPTGHVRESRVGYRVRSEEGEFT